MRRKEVIELLDAAQQKFPVDTWKVNGVDVWPLLKIHTFFLWLGTSAEPSEAKEKRQRKGTSIASLVRSLFQWCRFFLRRSQQVSIMFSGADSHRIDFQGSFFNRYFDPIIDVLEEESRVRCLHIEQTTRAGVKYYKSNRIIFLPPLYPLANLIVKLRYSGRAKRQLNGLTQLDSCLQFLTDGTGVDKRRLKSHLLYMIQSVLVWKAIFTCIFRKFTPKYVVGLCYYSLKMYGMNVSARALGIKSIDMQHGTQGPLHVAYANFSRIPSQGYNVLPEIFWCWDESSAMAIRQWTQRQNFHLTFVGGNPWLGYMMRSGMADPLVNFQKKMILYSLQPLEPILDDHVIEAIKRTPDEYQWWLRLHPRQLTDKPGLLKLLKDAGLANKVNVEDATALPLPALLMHAQIHLSKFSGTIIEARMMGVPNVILDAVGVASFETEIASGAAVACVERDATSLIAVIMDSCKRKATGTAIPDFRAVLDQAFNLNASLL